MLKKTKKVIKNKVECKKKKTSKKKVPKLVNKRKKKKKVSIDEVYKVLNKVQIKKKKKVFIVSLYEYEIIENIIKDTELEYNKVVMKTQVIFTIFPNMDEEKLDELDIEYLDDEIPEDGQIFC
jgi:dTDP-4-amino-4,6-dideoxygalactose transaminase